MRPPWEAVKTSKLEMRQNGSRKPKDGIYSNIGASYVWFHAADSDCRRMNSYYIFFLSQLYIQN